MRVGSLTPAEQRIVELASRGKTNREIAQLLDIKEQSVKNALSLAMRKLGVRNRVELVLAVRQEIA
jgi:two-component system, NarL family, nitrate/nitrite response regulator NarL